MQSLVQTGSKNIFASAWGWGISAKLSSKGFLSSKFPLQQLISLSAAQRCNSKVIQLTSTPLFSCPRHALYTSERCIFCRCIFIHRIDHVVWFGTYMYIYIHKWQRQGHSESQLNITRVQNCPDVAILNSPFGLCLLSFYRTQVSLGSNLWVLMSVTQYKTMCRIK